MSGTRRGLHEQWYAPHLLSPIRREPDNKKPPAGAGGWGIANRGQAAVVAQNRGAMICWARASEFWKPM